MRTPIGVLALTTLVVPFVANATSLVQEPCIDWSVINPDVDPQPWLGQSCIRAVIDMEVNGVRYDVSFRTWWDLTPADFSPEAEAQARALALLDAFGVAPSDSNGNVWLTINDGFYIPNSYADVPVDPVQVAPDGWDSEVFRVSRGGIGSDLWQLPQIAGEEFYARFSVHVPEPGTLALFSLSLAGLGVSRRRKAV